MNPALKIALKAVDSKKALDVVALDISAVASFADCFLICSGESNRQVQAIASEVEVRLAEGGFRPSHVEGYRNAEWILMDYLDLVVHIFSKRARAYYDLERLWRDARVIDAARLLAAPATAAAPRSRKRNS